MQPHSTTASPARGGTRLLGARSARAAAAGVHPVGHRYRRPIGRRHLRLARLFEGALVDDAVLPQRPRTTATFVAVLDKFYAGEDATLALRSSCSGPGKDQPAVRWDLAVSRDRLRRRVGPRDHLALTEAEFGQRHRHRRIVDVERDDQGVSHAARLVYVLPVGQGFAARFARCAATGDADVGRSGTGAAGRRRARFVDTHWGSGEFGPHRVVAAGPSSLTPWNPNSSPA